jgi:hypothetical protein
MKTLADFDAIWIVTMELYNPPGECPTPISMSAKEVKTGTVIQTANLPRECPFDTGPKTLHVFFDAVPVLQGFLALAWPCPANLVDLQLEHRRVTSGLAVPGKATFVGALSHHGLPFLTAATMSGLRVITEREGPYSPDELDALLANGETVVRSIERLLKAMEPDLDLPRALLRGRYLVSLAKMQAAGIPIDVETLRRIQRALPGTRRELIQKLDTPGLWNEGGLSRHRLEEFVEKRHLEWPRTPTGLLSTSAETLELMAAMNSDLECIRELSSALHALKDFALPIGRDGRHRAWVKPFGAVSGRDVRSSRDFVLSRPAWVRNLVTPRLGRALAYVDWASQELGIVAALSGDQAMREDYTSGDPYMRLAKKLGLAPGHATKDTHPRERTIAKTIALGTLYGMGPDTLAARIGATPAHAEFLLRKHREMFGTFWRWSEAAVELALQAGGLRSVFGWEIHMGPETNTRTVANFPAQANGGEMLRLACCLATESGIDVIATAHDAVLIEGDAARIHETVRQVEEAMREASRQVLGGFELRTESQVFTHPERFSDPQGARIWELIQRSLKEGDDE